MSNPNTKPILDLVRNSPHQHSYQSVAEQFGLTPEQVRGIARVHNVQGLFYKARPQRGKTGTEAHLQENTMTREPTPQELDALKAECVQRGSGARALP